MEKVEEDPEYAGKVVLLINFFSFWLLTFNFLNYLEFSWVSGKSFLSYYIHVVFLNSYSLFGFLYPTYKNRHLLVALVFNVAPG